MDEAWQTLPFLFEGYEDFYFILGGFYHHVVVDDFVPTTLHGGTQDASAFALLTAEFGNIQNTVIENVENNENSPVPPPSLPGSKTFYRLERVIVDTDQDGIPDYYEFQMEGADPFNNNGIPDGLEDSDGDGVDDSDEALAGTNPNDADSTPPLNFRFFTRGFGWQGTVVDSGFATQSLVYTEGALDFPPIGSVNDVWSGGVPVFAAFGAGSVPALNDDFDELVRGAFGYPDFSSGGFIPKDWVEIDTPFIRKENSLLNTESELRDYTILNFSFTLPQDDPNNVTREVIHTANSLQNVLKINRVFKDEQFVHKVKALKIQKFTGTDGWLCRLQIFVWRDSF